VKLITFKIVNCFGFRDSEWLNLKDEHNFIYILGRNSSGKSSVLNAIKYFEWGSTPSQQPNFQNFNDSGKAQALIATFQIGDSELSEQKLNRDLVKRLAALKIDEGSIKYNQKLRTLFDTIFGIYSELVTRINAAGEITIWKMSDGRYHFLETGNNEYKPRIEKVAAAIDAARESGQRSFNIRGSLTNLSITWNDFEDLLFLQFPNIYLFNEKFSLREVLPERIELNWENSNNQFLNTFVDYLGKEKVNRFLISNDPEEREEILFGLRERIKTLTNKVNQYRANSLNSDLLEIYLHEKNGIQITIRTDGKKSYYAHISDNTKSWLQN
jgi:AAA15 family ATPase/GTPase